MNSNCPVGFTLMTLCPPLMCTRRHQDQVDVIDTFSPLQPWPFLHLPHSPAWAAVLLEGCVLQATLWAVQIVRESVLTAPSTEDISKSISWPILKNWLLFQWPYSLCVFLPDLNFKHLFVPWKVNCNRVQFVLFCSWNISNSYGNMHCT